MMQEKKLRKKIKILLITFMTGLILSGLTAFPIETELEIACRNLNLLPGFMRDWINDVYHAVKTTNDNFPYLSYGTDWLAFAHLVIAVAFWGPLKDPVKNIWIVQFGIISCFMVLALAMIAGQIRNIPFYWRLIDCSFGLIGISLLFPCYNAILHLRKLQSR